jgi:hypothetical protein
VTQAHLNPIWRHQVTCAAPIAWVIRSERELLTNCRSFLPAQLSRDLNLRACDGSDPAAVGAANSQERVLVLDESRENSREAAAAAAASLAGDSAAAACLTASAEAANE